MDAAGLRSDCSLARHACTEEGTVLDRISCHSFGDINRFLPLAEPKLEASDSSFDAVLICVSVQYLQQPENVFAEIYRVLKPGGLCIVSFSNRIASKPIELTSQLSSIIIGIPSPSPSPSAPPAAPAVCLALNLAES